MLNKVHREMHKVGQIQPIKPDDRRVVAALLVRALLAVVVPVPRRRHDHVAWLHRHTAPVNGGEAALPFDDEAAGEGGVPVGGGRLAGLDQLQAGVEGVGGVGGGWEGLDMSSYGLGWGGEGVAYAGQGWSALARGARPASR